MNERPAFRGNLHRSSAELAEWLSLSREAPIEASLPLVDAHHHLWSDERGDYRSGEMAADMAGNNVVGTVYVECGTGYEAGVDYSVGPGTSPEPYMGPVLETAYAAAVAQEDSPARRFGICSGIVSFANLLLGDGVAAVLEAHIEAGAGRFRGIRQATGWEGAIGELAYRNPPPGLLLDPRFQAGFARLAPLGLTYDTWVFFHQMPDVMALADAFPDTTIILDHFGGLLGIGPYSGRDSAVFTLWRTYLRRLAERPNVVLKMGGLGMIATGFSFHLEQEPPESHRLADRWRPFVETAVEAFGAGRCMVGSNFPVDRQTSTYTAFWNAYKLCTRPCSEQERSAILSGTAARIYRLD